MRAQLAQTEGKFRSQILAGADCTQIDDRCLPQQISCFLQGLGCEHGRHRPQRRDLGRNYRLGHIQERRIRPNREIIIDGLFL